MDYNREPCPWRLFDEAGAAYSIGFVGAGMFSAVGGARNAPKGITFVISLYKLYEFPSVHH